MWVGHTQSVEVLDRTRRPDSLRWKECPPGGFKIYIFICVAPSGLSCDVQALLVVACDLLVAACGVF